MVDPMPPIHHAIVHFPIALTVTSVACDTNAFLGGPGTLASVGLWSIALAAAGALIAALAGYADMKRDDLAHETHELVYLHMKAGTVVVFLLMAIALWRWDLALPNCGYMTGSWLAVTAVALQAWLGGEIVYAHGGGVAAAGQGTMSAEVAKRPPRRLIRLVKGGRTSTRD